MVKDPPSPFARAPEEARSWQGDVGIAFVWDHLVPQRIKDGDFENRYLVCHSYVKSQWIERSVPLPFANLLLGVKFHYHMARPRPFMIAFMLSTHPRVGQASLIGSLTPDTLRHILELAGPLGGVIPRPGAALSLMRLIAGPQVDRRDRVALLAVRHQPPALLRLFQAFQVDAMTARRKTWRKTCFADRCGGRRWIGEIIEGRAIVCCGESRFCATCSYVGAVVEHGG
jgi:hypothetical protein